MQRYTAREAIEITRIRAFHFLDHQDRGDITPEVVDGKATYSLESLRKLVEIRHLGKKEVPYPPSEYVRAYEAMELLGISRGTFYKRVALKQIETHKHKGLTFVKKSDLYARDDLF